LFAENLSNFSIGAIDYLIKLREGAGYYNYQKFLSALPKKVRYTLERV